MMYSQYHFGVHKNKQVRLIVDSDAKCEADDQYAIVHALLTPKFQIKGIVAAHFSTVQNNNTMSDSFKEINKILSIMKLNNQVGAYKGAANALKDEFSPEISEGAELIVREAMAEDDTPLFAIFQGPLTDIASAYLIQPKIAKRINVIWIGGGAYPEGGKETNLKNDIIAANVVFNSRINLWQIPAPAFALMKVGLAELEYKVRPCGQIGRYLFEQLVECDSHFSTIPNKGWPKGESWVLGDSAAIGVLLDPHNHYFDSRPAPSFSKKMDYIHEQANRPIRVYSYVDSRFILEDMFCKLALKYQCK